MGHCNPTSKANPLPYHWQFLKFPEHLKMSHKHAHVSRKLCYQAVPAVKRETQKKLLPYFKVTARPSNKREVKGTICL